MPISFQCPPNFPLAPFEMSQLWQATVALRAFPDHEAALKCVDAAEISRLNKEYRGKDEPTNVLTFSYGKDGPHDIALCMAVAEKEAAGLDVPVRDYVALLLVHAFLHATGMDHEISEENAQATEEAEQAIMGKCGFRKISLQ